MAVIAKELVDSVAILFRPNPNSQVIEPVGTAFIVRFRENLDDQFNSFYLVSCQHCINLATLARLSTGDQIPVRREDWTVAPTGDDVAAIDITGQLIAPLDRFGFVELSSMVQDMPSNINVGSDLFMLGLFANEPDTGANVPRARFGNVSAMASSGVPVSQGNGANRPSHLGDMRSRTGFSGSPVFAYETLSGYGSLVQRTHWLGIHSGQFPDRLNVLVGGKTYPADIPASMTIIVPAWVMIFIEQDAVFAAKREAHRRALSPPDATTSQPS